MNRDPKLECRECEALLDAALSGTLDERGLRLVESHLETCPECRELFAVARSARDGIAGAETPDQTGAILARTSGSACGRARQLLPAMIDGDIGLEDAALLDGHLQHCPECAALADALAWSAPVLLELAEVDPGEDFTLGVLAATLPTVEAAPAAAGIDRLTRWCEAAGEWLRSQMARPRFSFEAAYVGTLILVLLFGTPVSPLKDAPPKALAAIQAGPAALFGGGVRLEQTLPGHAFVLGQAACIGLYKGVAATADEIGADISARNERTGPVVADLRRGGDALLDAIGEGDFVLAATCFDGLRRNAAAAWNLWWKDPAEPPEAVSDGE